MPKPRKPQPPEDEPDDLPEGEEDELESAEQTGDLAGLTREEWLTQAINRCLTAAEKWSARGHGGTAARWETQAQKCRDELDKLHSDRAKEAAGRVARDDSDPAFLAVAVLAQLPVVVRLAPQHAEEVWAELGRLLGKDI